MNNLINKAKCLPIGPAMQAISVAPIRFNIKNRPIPLEVRVTAPLTGSGLPVVLLSHGGGPSMYVTSRDGYGPLVNFLGEHGFVVIQPTHQSSKVGGFAAPTPTDPIVWQSRVNDLSAIIDLLDEIEDVVPTLKGRVDKTKVSAVGHSFGGHTVVTLLGSLVSDLKDPSIRDTSMLDPRVKAGVVLGALGNLDGLSDWGRENLPFMNPNFAHMAAPVLVVNGDHDHMPFLNTRGPSWHEDAFHHGPSPKALLTVRDGKHGFGGIAGYDAKETDDEDPDRLEMVRRMIWAYLRTALGVDESSWPEACKALTEQASSLASVLQK